MVSRVLAILLSIAGVLPQTAQTPTKAEFSPSVSLSLPPDMLSETVQVSYFLIGPFGGHGGYTTGRAGVHSYEIPALVEGKAATEIRMIVYAPGCEIQQFFIPLAEHARVSQEFPCQPVQTVKLSGRIVPDELVRDNRAELVVTFMAHWAHRFYGITDGPVTEFRLATISPDANGMFAIDLPYFSADAEVPSSELRASFRLMLRDAKTWNAIVFNLEPEVPDFRSEDHCLRIQSHYPEGLNFVPPGRLGTVRGKVFRSDSGEAISNSYILLTSENGEANHFDTKTDEKGEYLFGGIPPGNYRCLSMRGFPKGVKCPARIPSNKKRWMVATSRSNGSGRVRHSWKSSNSKVFPSNLTGRMLKTSI